MSVLIDTPVWSFALRRKPDDLSASEQALLEEWRRLVQARQVMLIGPIRQEILSGIRQAESFNRVRLRLRAFVDESLTTEDFEEAARCSNRCRAAGIAGSGIDFLLCAVALRRAAAIFTTDSDFSRYARVLALRLHEPSV